MLKTNLPLAVIIIIGTLAVAIVVVVLLYSGEINNNSYNYSPIPTQIATPTPSIIPTLTETTPPTSTPKATPNPKLTVTYSEFSRNETMIVIHFKLEPNSYIFQVNATSFYLVENGNKISSSLNDAVIIGTQYSVLYFPIDNYNGTNYAMSCNALPADTIWIRQ